jgi:hypothetical protein
VRKVTPKTKRGGERTTGISNRDRSCSHFVHRKVRFTEENLIYLAPMQCVFGEQTCLVLLLDRPTLARRSCKFRESISQFYANRVTAVQRWDLKFVWDDAFCSASKRASSRITAVKNETIKGSLRVLTVSLPERSLPCNHFVEKG